MSDPEVPQPKQPADANNVSDSADAGLADADVAATEAPSAATYDAPETDVIAEDAAAGEPVGTDSVSDAVDPDLAAFEEAERNHPGTFNEPVPAPPAAQAQAPAPTDDPFHAPESFDERVDAETAVADADATLAEADAAAGGTSDAPVTDRSFNDTSAADASLAEASIADTAYRTSDADDTATRVVPAEPVDYSDRDALPTAVAAPPAYAQQQPIFVQAPEAPRERSNRGTVAGIGLLATLSFAILYLATALGLRALAGEITGENFVDAIVEPLLTWGFWVPVVVFFIGFWLLGSIINRGRWGRWVVFGIIVGLFAYVGHILGQLFEAPFWLLTASEGSEIVGAELLAPLAIAAFVFARELTIWFGAWAARSGARKTELNAEAQREYERTLEAGPTLSR